MAQVAGHPNTFPESSQRLPTLEVVLPHCGGAKPREPYSGAVFEHNSSLRGVASASQVVQIILTCITCSR